MLIPIPNELLLVIFHQFHLTTLLIGRAVCRKWRDLLPLADIHPTRRALLDLYKHIIHEPWFLDSRPWVLENLKPFDREAYVDVLHAQHNYLPEEFRVWVLEWPAKAVFFGIWPGLPPFTYDLVGPGIPARWLVVWNLMDPSNPVVRTINVVREDVDPDFDLDPGISMDFMDFIQPLPGLPIFMEEAGKTTWLMLDKGNYRDLVVRTFESDHDIRESIEGYPVVRMSWIDCLNQRTRTLQYLHGIGEKGDVPIILDTRPPSKMIKLSPSCTPWTSSGHVPYLRSIDYVSDGEENGEEEEEEEEG